MKRLAFWIAAAALLVSAPRLALAFLLADGVQLAPDIEAGVYAGTGIASGLVLTGGNVYLAHALAEHYKRRGPLWLVLLGSWVLFLGFAVVLIAPALVAGLKHSVLAEVLTSDPQRWAWAVVAALSVEVLAAAAMAASVLSAEPTQVSVRTGVARERASGAGSLPGALSGAAVRLLSKVGADRHASLPAPMALLSAEHALQPAPLSVSAPPPTTWTGPTATSAALASDAATPVTTNVVGRYSCRSAGCSRVFATPQARSAHEGRAHPPTEASG